MGPSQGASPNASNIPHKPVQKSAMQNNNNGNNHVQQILNSDPQVVSDESFEQPNTELGSRKIHQIFDYGTDLTVTREVIDNLRNHLKSGADKDSNTTGNIDLVNIISKDEGIYSLLTTEGDGQSVFINVVEQRIQALENHNQAKPSKNLKKHIAKIKAKLDEFKNNPQDKTSLIKLINQCDKENKFIGLTTKITGLLLELQDGKTVENFTVNLNKIEIKGKDFDNTALGKLDYLYRKSLLVKHSKCVYDILSKIKCEDNKYTDALYTKAVSLPSKGDFKTKDFLQSFIEQKPEIAAELIYDRALIYASMNNSISVIHGKSKNVAEKILQAAKAMNNTPESINNFLKGLTSSQREFFIKNTVNELIDIQIELVKKQISLTSSDNIFSNKIEKLHVCETTINLLKKNYKSYNNYKDYNNHYKNNKSTQEIASLNTLLVSTKASIIANFLEMQHQLAEPTKTKKSSDDKKSDPQRMLLLNKLSEEEIIEYLQSIKTENEWIQDLLENIVNYVDCILLYKNWPASDAKLTKDDESRFKEEKIRLQNARFDMLKSQQYLLDHEIVRMIYTPTYKSKLVEAKDFNEMQLKSSIAYDIRKNNRAIVRNSKGIIKNIFTPSMNYEQPDRARIEENLNEKIKETLNYSLTGEIRSTIKAIVKKKETEKSATTIKLEMGKNERLEEIANAKDGVVSSTVESIRVVLREKLLYIEELSKSNPGLFRSLVVEIAQIAPVLIHIFGKDVLLSTLVKDIAKKINEQNFLDGIMTDVNSIPLFHSDFNENTDIDRAEAMKTVFFINDVMNLFNTYGVRLIDSIATLLPTSSLTKVCDTIAKETAKRGGVHLATDFVFYAYSSIKNDEPSSSYPGKSILENYGLRFFTTYTRAFKRIITAISNAIAKKPNAKKKVGEEAWVLAKVLGFTALLTISITAVLVLLFDLPAIIAIIIGFILALNLFHIQAMRQYGVTEHNLSLASVVENYYNKCFDVNGSYKHKKTWELFQKEFDAITKYNNTGSDGTAPDGTAPDGTAPDGTGSAAVEIPDFIELETELKEPLGNKDNIVPVVDDDVLMDNTVPMDDNINLMGLVTT